MNRTQPHIAFHDIINSLEKYKSRDAIIDKNGVSYSYGEFKTFITGARSELLKRGVKKGDKILVFVPMSMELYAILEAIFSIGATAIFLDPWMKGRKMSSVINQVKPDLFIVTKRIARISWLLPSTWKLKKWKLRTLTPNNDDWIIEDVQDDDNALITFTSGTSGTPKGANRTFSFLHAQALTLRDHLKGNENSACIDYTNFPIVGLADFSLGNTVVVPQINLMKIHKANSYQVIKHIQDTNVMRIIVSPSLLNIILKGVKTEGKGNIEEVITGGAPISNKLIKDCVECHQNIVFEAIYGSTEAEPICLSSFKDIYKNRSSPLEGVYVGKPIPEIEVCILKPINSPVNATYFHKNTLDDESIGEIVVNGGHVNKQYYNNSAAFKKTKIVDREGVIWHRTGDIGYFKNGYLYLVGRDHRIMQTDQSAVYPYPIEQEIESKFGYADVGYVKNSKDQFVLHVGSQNTVKSKEIKAHLIAKNIPCDEVRIHKKALPRDARHRSKLQIETLL